MSVRCRDAIPRAADGGRITASGSWRCQAKARRGPRLTSHASAARRSIDNYLLVGRVMSTDCRHIKPASEGGRIDDRGTLLADAHRADDGAVLATLRAR